MSGGASTPELPLDDDMARALLAQDSVLAVMRQALAAADFRVEIADLSFEAQKELLEALIADGALSIGPGRVLTAEETRAFFLDADNDNSRDNP